MKTITLEVIEGRIQLPWINWRGIEISKDGIHTPKGLISPVDLPEMIHKARIQDKYEYMPNGVSGMDFNPESLITPMHSPSVSHGQDRKVGYRRKAKPGKGSPMQESYYLIEKYLEDCKLAWSTKELYRRCISYLYEYCEQNKLYHWRDVTLRHVEKYIKEKDVSKKAKHMYISAIRGFYDYLISIGEAETNPACGMEGRRK